MAEEKPSLHIDTDWKKQAQEEKKRLAEQEQQRPAVQPGPSSPPQPPPLGEPAAASAARPPRRGERGEIPTASLAALVQSLLTQVLFYLGELAVRGVQPTVNLDMAKYNIDLMSVLEEKTANNLTPEERQMLDAALYESRMRYVSVASQFT